MKKEGKGTVGERRKRERENESVCEREGGKLNRKGKEMKRKRERRQI
jgi:hypothetical protein